jgi:hypothetical protein
MAQKEEAPDAVTAPRAKRNTTSSATPTSTNRAKQGHRPVYTIRLRPEPGIDAVRSLRALLKAALRRYGLRCTDIRGGGP